MIIKWIFALFLLTTLVGCSKNHIFPTDTKVYDAPENYDYNYNEFYFKSSQEALLRGWYFRAKGPSRGIIVVSNGIIYNMSERFKKWTWVLAEGYDLFIYDFRGYGDSRGEVDMFGFVDDVSAAIAYAHGVDENLPMVVVGQSMGGSFVIDAMAKQVYPYVRLLLIDSTMQGFALAADDLIKKHFLLWPLIWVPDAFTPVGVDSIDYVDSTNTPTLFLVGLQDSIIEPEHSVNLYLKAKEPKALWIVEDAEHVECICKHKVKAALKKVLDASFHNSYEDFSGIRYFKKEKMARPALGHPL